MKNVVGVWCLLVGLAPGMPAAAAESKLVDCSLVVKARHVLTTDSDLALWNLGVSVRDRVATVWGKVPSTSMAKRACDRVRQVPGIADVVSEIKVGVDRDPQEPWLHSSRSIIDPLRFEAPRTRPRDAGDITLQPIWLAPEMPSNWRSTPPAPAKAIPPSSEPHPAKEPAPVKPTAAGKPANVQLLIPQPVDIPRESLGDRVAKLCRQDPRFRGIHPDVKEGKVYLHGTVQRWEDIHVLAKQVSVLPGVERVILGNLRRN